MNVGFAGLGRMGLAMARNVLHAGFPLTVYNRTSGRAEALVEEGARAVERPDHLGACDLVVTMVSDAAAARAVLVEGGLLDALLPGSIVIETRIGIPSGAGPKGSCIPSPTIVPAGIVEITCAIRRSE